MSRDVLPGGLTYVSSTPTAGAYNPTSGIWTLGPLASKAGATLQIVATVGTASAITNTAEVSGSDQTDPNSTPGNGTIIRIRVPLTLAIVPTLMDMLADQIVAFPLVNVSEIFDLPPGTTHTVDGQLVVQMRSRPLPLFHLRQWASGGSVGEAKAGTHVVVVQVGGRQAGFMVDQLLGQEEVVVRLQRKKKPD